MFFDIVKVLILVVSFVGAFLFLPLIWKILKNWREISLNREALKIARDAKNIEALPFWVKERVKFVPVVDTKKNEWVIVPILSETAILRAWGKEPEYYIHL